MKPTNQYYSIVSHLLYYLKGTQTCEIHYKIRDVIFLAILIALERMIYIIVNQ